eukprot:Rmarinus@m.10335
MSGLGRYEKKASQKCRDTHRKVSNPDDFDEDYDTRDYILQSCWLNRSETVAVAFTDDQVSSYRLAEGGLVRQGPLAHHTGTVNAMECCDDLLYTASSDNVAAAWDTRGKSEKSVLNLRHDSEVWGVSANKDKHHVATAVDTGILVWDRRACSSPLRTIDYVHSDAVTCVRWHRDGTHVLSGSEDGIACYFDPFKTDEDEALEQGTIFSVGQPVRAMDFFGASKYVWAVTTVETLGLYRIEDSRQLAYFKSAREEIGGLTCLPDEEDATASSKYEPGSAPVDYVLSCYCKEESGRLYLASGKNNGDLILAHVNLGRFSVQQLLTGGHDTIVRTCCWNNDGSVMITGDEHAQLTAWRLSSSCPASHSTAATRKDLQKERVQRRKAPY